MKQLIVSSIIFTVAACNTGVGSGPGTDSLGSRTADTNSRNDTMYYERMTNKTGRGDSNINRGGTQRQDTAYYERLGNKIAPDSTR